MSKHILLCLSVCLLVVGMAAVATADVPQLIYYQGFLTTPNPSGNYIPVNGPRNLRFSIYDAATTGDMKWGIETHNGVLVKLGIFSVMLGAGNMTPILITDDVFNEPGRWLQIEIDDAGTWDPISPRIELVTVPYAFRVATVDSATGGTIKSDVKIQGTVEVNGFKMLPGANPDYVLTSDAAGVGTWQDPATLGFSDNDWALGTVGDDVLFTIDEWGIARAGNTLFGINDSTHVNLGVSSTTGTSGQDYKYATVGGGLDNTASGTAATVPGGSLNVAAGDYSFAAGRAAQANHSGTFVWADATGTNFGSTGINQFLIKADGGVGIMGNSTVTTLTPAAQLHVLQNPSPGPASTAMARFERRKSPAEVDQDNWLDITITSNPVGGGDGNAIAGASATFRMGEPFGFGDMAFTTNTTEIQMIIKNNGNVGIGDYKGGPPWDPTERLDVNGTARLRVMPGPIGGEVDVQADPTGVLRLVTSSKRYKTNIRELDVNPEKVFDLNPVRFQWKSSGNEDIGLIAEEVDEVISDLVIYDQDGKPKAVKYDKVAIYLLGVVKQQQNSIKQLESQLVELRGLVRLIAEDKAQASR